MPNRTFMIVLQAVLREADVAPVSDLSAHRNCNLEPSADYSITVSAHAGPSHRWPKSPLAQVAASSRNCHSAAGLTDEARSAICKWLCCEHFADCDACPVRENAMK